MNSIIKKVKMGIANVYLINTEKGFILVDSGMKNKINKLEKTLNKIDAKLKDIVLIVITHVHYDHVWSLYQLKEKTNAKILIHNKEKNILQKGKTNFPKWTMFIFKIISKFGSFISKGSFRPVKADIVINNFCDLKEYWINAKIIHTPWHTSWSISVIVEDKYIICGDTFFNLLPNCVYPRFANDEKTLLKTFVKINKYNFEKFFPGHGDIFGKEKFIKTLNSSLVKNKLAKTNL